jgi:AcrR family transcriptional regulator
MTDPQSRRERRAARKREQILEAAASVFAEQGFRRATTKDIAEAADIAEGTIYNYFQSKDDLLMGILDQLANLEERRVIMDHALQEDFQTFFTRHLTDRLNLSQENYTLLIAVLPELFNSTELREKYRETLYEPAMKMLELHLQARRDAGQIPPIDVSIVSRLLSAITLGTIMLALLDESVAESLTQPAVIAKIITAFSFGGLEAVITDPAATTTEQPGSSSQP